MLATLLTSTFTIPHLIDDLVFGEYEDFGLTIQTAQVLSGVFAVPLILGTVLAAKGMKVGYGACVFLGSTLAIASILKHLPLMLAPGRFGVEFSQRLSSMG